MRLFFDTSFVHLHLCGTQRNVKRLWSSRWTKGARRSLGGCRSWPILIVGSCGTMLTPVSDSTEWCRCVHEEETPSCTLKSSDLWSGDAIPEISFIMACMMKRAYLVCWNQARCGIRSFIYICYCCLKCEERIDLLTVCGIYIYSTCNKRFWQALVMEGAFYQLRLTWYI